VIRRRRGTGQARILAALKIAVFQQETRGYLALGHAAIRSRKANFGAWHNL
jgi:hypothetical protein